MNRNKLARLVLDIHGSAAVETGVVLPLLVLLALGATDLGRYSHAYIAVATAARNGAQYGSTSINVSQDSSGIRTAAQAEMNSVYGYSSSNSTVTTTRIDEGGGDWSIKVTVSFQFATIIKYPVLPQTMNLVRTVHMRVLPIEVGDDEVDEDD